jgi:hypothetical protein
MNADLDVSGHYGRGNLRGRLNAALTKDGYRSQSFEQAYDHFHRGGLEATVESANLLRVDAGDHIPDIGCSIRGQRVTLRIASATRSPGSTWPLNSAIFLRSNASTRS